MVDYEYKVINSLVLSETLNAMNICEKRKSLDKIYNILSETAEIIYLKQEDYLEAIN